MNLTQDIRIQFLAKFLVILPFLAKISFEFLKIIPSEWGFIVYQHGMHPYLNILLCLLAGLPLAFLALLNANKLETISVFYKVFFGVSVFAIWSQSLMQIFFGSDISNFMTVVAALMATYLIFMYGWLIPRLMTLEDFLDVIGRCAQVLVLGSLFLWVVTPEVTFKGSRFIGIFKHIPYMVTCSTLACSFSLPNLVKRQNSLYRLFHISLWLVSFWSLLLTGTRSATFAVLFSALAFFLLVRPKIATIQFLKLALVVFASAVFLLFGNRLFDYGYQLVRGEQALAGRHAQDGVKSRMEEIERGYATFLESPWLGKGLLSKFNTRDAGDLAQYDALKDPHNIFISAGVLGGWGFIILAFLGLILLSIGGIKALRSKDIGRRTLALYILSQIPILIIYHVHLSLGGLADRIYWLVFGFLALHCQSQLTGKGINSNPEQLDEKVPL